MRIVKSRYAFISRTKTTRLSDKYNNIINGGTVDVALGYDITYTSFALFDRLGDKSNLLRDWSMILRNIKEPFFKNRCS